ncbi:MAG: hypothetical protein MJE12_06010 [Alphaproteobacteria bacterium]|nr:hypothetical protein [Alphaproteobacteria bacterium]
MGSDFRVTLLEFRDHATLFLGQTVDFFFGVRRLGLLRRNRQAAGDQTGARRSGCAGLRGALIGAVAFRLPVAQPLGRRLSGLVGAPYGNLLRRRAKRLKRGDETSLHHESELSRTQYGATAPTRHRYGRTIRFRNGLGSIDVII